MMFGARIHATTFDEEDTFIVILRYESRRSLLISENLHDPPEIHAIERALRHAIELALSAAWRSRADASTTKLSLLQRA